MHQTRRAGVPVGDAVGSGMLDVEIGRGLGCPQKQVQDVSFGEGSGKSASGTYGSETRVARHNP